MIKYLIKKSKMLLIHRTTILDTRTNNTPALSYLKGGKIKELGVFIKNYFMCCSQSRFCLLQV